MANEETTKIRGRAKVKEADEPSGSLEVAGRSPDSDSSEADHRFRRSFTVARADLDSDDEYAETVHQANQALVVREAINHGVVPEGHATFDGSDDVAGQPGVLVLRYSVAASYGPDAESEN